MVKAAMPLVTTRDSITPMDRQLVFASVQNDLQTEELKRSYSIQNNLLARKNEELQLRVTNLENQLFQTQKQVLALKNDKIQLNERLRLNSKRFNDIIVDSLDKLMSEYRSFMADVGVDVSKKDIPLHLSQKVNNEEPYHKATDFEHYWRNINDDLRRRKSSLFNFRNGTSDTRENIDMALVIPTQEGLVEDDQLDTLVEKDEESPLEPEYEDESSINVPVKRQSMVMEKMENAQLSVIPFLGLSSNSEKEHEEPFADLETTDNNNDDLFNQIGDSSGSPVSPVKTNHHIDVNLGLKEDAEVLFSNNNQKDDDMELRDPKERRMVKRRKNKIPRELRNLDTEKTKKWLGMDPLDDVEESTSDRRKSRRRSLVVNYQLPSLKQKMRRTSGRFSDVYIDQDKENRVVKPKNKANRNVLKNITNTSHFTRRDSIGKDDREKSIFDLENADIFSDYNKRASLVKKTRNRNEAYDMLL